jgi:hypothetical protein
MYLLEAFSITCSNEVGLGVLQWLDANLILMCTVVEALCYKPEGRGFESR